MQSPPPAANKPAADKLIVNTPATEKLPVNKPAVNQTAAHNQIADVLAGSLYRD